MMLTKGRATEITTFRASPCHPRAPPCPPSASHLYPIKHHISRPDPVATESPTQQYQSQLIPITLTIGGVGWGGRVQGQAESLRAGSCWGAVCRSLGTSERWGGFRATSPIKGRPGRPSQLSCFDSMMMMPGNPANLNITLAGSCRSSHPIRSPL